MSDFRFFEFFDNILNLSRQEFFLIFLDHFYLLATFLGQRERWVPINHRWAGMGKMSLQTTHTCIGVCVCVCVWSLFSVFQVFQVPWDKVETLRGVLSSCPSKQHRHST